MSTSTYPVRLDAELDPRLLRWLWLVKWLLALPHVIVLAFLWVGFLVMWLIALVGILITGRYPRAVFDFNVGVLRWTWRVSYYAVDTAGTDRYPPFTLRDVEDYPARLQIDYPEAPLSRGLALVKWWVLVIPHYLVLGAAFATGGATLSDDDAGAGAGLSLVQVLTLIALVALLFTARYPRSIFDFLIGLNRWAFRVAAYASLMTDQYPPFRLDMGGQDPGTVPGAAAVPEAAAPPGGAVPPGAAPGYAVGAPAGTPSPPAGPPTATGWTAGRVASVAIGGVFLLMALGFGSAAAALGFANSTMRDDDGFLMSPDRTFSTETYAVVSDNIEMHVDTPSGRIPEGIVGDTRITADATGETPVFLGIGPTDEVRAYLAGVARVTVVGMDEDGPDYRFSDGTAPETPPGELDFWVEQAESPGTQTISWPLESGDWTVVLMNADGSAGVSADLAAGATVPALDWVIGGLLTVMVFLLIASLLLIGLPLWAVARTPTTPSTPTTPILPPVASA